jgi:hypothetical protein
VKLLLEGRRNDIGVGDRQVLMIEQHLDGGRNRGRPEP